MTPIFSFKANVFALVLIFSVISTITYAFASSNTGDSDLAGYGAESINGYVVSDVSYELGNDSPKITSVSFTLNAPAAKVQIKLSDVQTNWFGCLNVSGNNWTCDANNSALSSASKLQVAAISN
jgi:hypothetical protein